MKEKKFNPYEFKFISLKVEDIDEGSRRVKVGLSGLNNIDSDEDIIRPGAFLKSIAERGPDSNGNRKISFMRHHDWQHEVGKWDELGETKDHLVGVGQLGRSDNGRNALWDYQDGIITEHSIGFNYVAGKIDWVEDDSFDGGGFYDVTEVNLWEGSAVAFGANENTPTFDVAKGSREALLSQLNKEFEALTNALKNGKGTDGRLYQIEMGIKVLQKKINTVLSIEPGIDKPTLKTEAIIKPGAEPGKSELMLNLCKNLKL